MLGLAGCSTPGPLHLYSVATGAAEIHDVAVNSNDAVQATPSYLEADDNLTGFAYDPFTDHFFLRLAPGNHIRVVDRPARKIKREFDVEGVAANTSGDLAVSPRDGHIFFVDPSAPALDETTRFGKFVQRIELQGRKQPAAAVAFDSGRNELLVLNADGVSVDRFGLRGEKLGGVTLDRRVRPSLAYDPERRELFAPLDGAPEAGAFDERGHCVRTNPIDPTDRFIDVGPHSFLRVF